MVKKIGLIARVLSGRSRTHIRVTSVFKWFEVGMLIELSAKDCDISAEWYDCGVNVLTYSLRAVVEIANNLKEHMREVRMCRCSSWYFLEEIWFGIVTLD